MVKAGRHMDSLPARMFTAAHSHFSLVQEPLSRASWQCLGCMTPLAMTKMAAHMAERMHAADSGMVH